MTDRRLVYSSDSGRVGPPPAASKSKPKPAPARKQPSMPVVADGVVRIFRERGQRGGKTMTVVRGLPERGVDLPALALTLKRLCGAGGTVRDCFFYC